MKVENYRLQTPNIKASLLKNIPAKDTHLFDCPIPNYKPAPKKIAESKEQIFGFYNGNSLNTKSSISKSKAQEIENTIHQFHQITQVQRNSKSPDRSRSPLKNSPQKYNQAITLLSKTYKQTQVTSQGDEKLNFGINTVKQSKIQELQNIQKSKAPKLQRPKTATTKSKQKKQKLKTQEELEDQNAEPFGEIIQEKKTQLIPIIDKNDFKYFKPWIIEPTKPLPQWAEDMQDKPLSAILEKDLKILNQTNELHKKQIEFNPDSLSAIFDPSQWIVNDVVLRRAGALPQQKAANESKTDHSKRLAEIYTKFLDTYDQYKDKINFEEGIDEPFDPRQARERIQKRLEKQVVEQKIQSQEVTLKILNENQDLQDDIQSQIHGAESEFVVESDDDFDFESQQVNGTESYQMELDEVEKIPKKLREELEITEIIIERNTQEARIQNEQLQKKLDAQRFLDEENKKIEDEEIRQSLMSDFAKQLEQLVKIEFDKAKPLIALDLVYEEEKQKKEKKDQELRILQEEEANRQKKTSAFEFQQQKRDRQQNRINKILGVKGGKTSTRLDAQLDNWISNFDKKLKDEETLTKALANNHLENQKELKETLREFEDALKYYENIEQYDKDMKKYMRKLELIEERDKNQINSPPQDSEQQFNFVGQKPAKEKNLSQKVSQKINVDISSILSQNAFKNLKSPQSNTLSQRTLVFQRVSTQKISSEQDYGDQIDEARQDMDSPFVLTPTRLQKISIPLEIYQGEENDIQNYNDDFE
ncbi:UNKNOWN [Stylonychia lemnae]|uniref:Uncharacterized protein n=1 Tax=Stylonychia lemnae TaxID=5949 RepID=A0A078B311_STYLE|nr:UNKNOWN [Stylonychia lemnae]|eukprot:CDW87632.1 UNKNOWN [Stylonychia lemnae]